MQFVSTAHGCSSCGVQHARFVLAARAYRKSGLMVHLGWDHALSVVSEGKDPKALQIAVRSTHSRQLIVITDQLQSPARLSARPSRWTRRWSVVVTCLRISCQMGNETTAGMFTAVATVLDILCPNRSIVLGKDRDTEPLQY